jgi:hypothetical protein
MINDNNNLLLKSNTSIHRTSSTRFDGSHQAPIDGDTEVSELVVREIRRVESNKFIIFVDGMSPRIRYGLPKQLRKNCDDFQR